MSLGLQKALESSYVMNTFARMPVEFVEGHGMTLVGDDGTEYRDFLAGIGVCSLGHCHPVLVEAIQRQAERLLHVSNYYYIERRGELAAILSKLASGDMDGALMIADAVRAGDEAAAVALGLPTENDQVWKTFFANSGAEANECAIKAARKWSEEKKGKDYSPPPCRTACKMPLSRCRKIFLPARLTTWTSSPRSSRNTAARSAPLWSSPSRVRAAFIR